MGANQNLSIHYSKLFTIENTLDFTKVTSKTLYTFDFD